MSHHQHPGALAWLSVLVVGVPFAVVAVVLGPVIGASLQPEPIRFFDDPYITFITHPEPTELARVLIAAAAPIAVAACELALKGRPLPPAARRLARGAAVIVPALGVLVAAAAVLKREPDFGNADLATFSTGQLLFALIFLAVSLLLANSGRVRSVLMRLHRATSGGVLGAVLAGLVALLTAAWLLPAIFTEQNIAASDAYVWRHLQVQFEDFAAVANGATPMVDYASPYSNLLPYVLDPLLALIGFTHVNFTVLATVLSFAALLAVYATLRIITSSKLAALGLYIPILGATLLPPIEVGDRVSNAGTYATLPLRYLMPLAIAWLLARHLVRRRFPHPVVLFLIAGLAAFNNPEFGTACFCALLVALAIAGDDPPGTPSSRWLQRIAAYAVLGAAIAVVAVCALTLLRAGELPNPDVMLHLPRVIAGQGFGMVPLPAIGLYLFIYLTFAGAVVLAGARAAGAQGDRPLTGLLAYAGVFGLGAGLYYGGRSLPGNLLALYPAWGLAVALLVWAVLVELRSKATMRTAISRVGAPGVAVLFALGLLVTTLVSFPTPWTQVRRIAAKSAEPSPVDVGEDERFVREWSDPGDDVALIATMGHYTAREAGVSDVSFLSSPEYFVSPEQVDRVLDALSNQGGDTLFTTMPELPKAATGLTTGMRFPLPKGIPEYLETLGWMAVASDPAAQLTAWQHVGNASVRGPTPSNPVARFTPKR